MGTFIALFLKAVIDPKVLAAIGPGWIALGVSGYVYAQVSGVQGDVRSIRQDTLEQKLDKAYTALCMRPGDPDLLERVRELQQQYFAITERQYDGPPCSLLMKLAQ